MNPEELQAQINEAAALGKEAELKEALRLYKSTFPGKTPTVTGIDPKTGQGWDVEALFGENKNYELGTAGKVGVGAKGVSVLGDILSLATAKGRQEETVDAYKDLSRKVGEATVVDPSAVNLATLTSQDGSARANATLAELLDQGVDPAKAAQISQNMARQTTADLTAQLNQYGRQKQTAEEQAKSRANKYDAIATQAGLPIDFFKEGAGIASKAGDLGLGIESLMNPLPTASARSGMKMEYEDGGSLQTTQGASDHSENPMMVTNKDGSPAVDEEGRQIEVTGKETIIPDWLMEQLIEAAQMGPEELMGVFKDEIIDEERFQA